MSWSKILFLFACLNLAARAATLDLAGAWEVSLTDPATAAKWQPIKLPGTLDDAGLGAPLILQPALTLQVLTRLQRKFTHIGPAWYRHTVEIPAAWSGQSIALELERVLWESRVFVDGREVSRADSLTTPHTHDLTAALAPGRHELLLRIDNSEIYSEVSHHARSYVGREDAPLAHAYTNHTQVMWNGVLGHITLRASVPTAPKVLRIDAGLAPAPTLTVRVTTHAKKATDAKYHLTLRRVGETKPLAEQTAALDAEGRVVWTLPADVKVSGWDEFSPAVYELTAALAGRPDTALTTTFGFRELTAVNREFQINSRRIFLRGNLECCIFPLTGHPPTDRAAWIKLLSTAKAWGLNHLRFHSWCPPEAAFAAADELGLYFQVELPHWSLNVGKDAATVAFLSAEADRMLATYGNHPSFLFLSLGNELQGDMDSLHAEVSRLRAQDNRHLYTSTTFTFEKGHGRTPEPGDDFFITQYTTDGWVRGQGVFNEQPPGFDGDYSAAARKVAVPLVAHEIGQYSVYPDLAEIARYTGNLVPLNFIAVRDDLAKKDLLTLAPQFTAASGKFATLLYKEEIERALRTPEVDGFQLLELQDFPGQGTALVGVLNAFWEPKGFVTAAEFRRFCGPVVPLARFPKAIYERGETFSAKIEIANFFRALPICKIKWIIRDDRGATVAEGKLPTLDLASGGTSAVGEISVPIPAGDAAARWSLEITLAGTEFRNAWNIWVYPRAARADAAIPGNITLATTLAEAETALAAGRRVLFSPAIEKIAGIPGKFVPVFWSPVHFPNQPGTMGLLCDPLHPALAGFPTDFHSDWQWWNLTLRSKSVVLDGLAATPIVRVIDNFNRNHSLANVFEAKVGPGRLLFSAIDLTTDLAARPTARQLRASLLAYAASGAFKPTGDLTAAQLTALVSAPVPPSKK
jgi:hypothetical protein